MLSLTSLRSAKPQPKAGQKGFDDFQVSLGDMMRGERATLGKSLMDVQRELKIKAAYIAAVEDANPSVFDTPGFIAGYVRSYAKYLGMDAELAFSKFCAESGFEPIHGMSEKALPVRMSREERLSMAKPATGFGGSATPFVPPQESFFGRFDVKAFASSAVLLCVLGGLGYGAYNVVQKIQHVQVTPIEHAPLVQTDLDPLAPRAGTGDQMQSLAADGDAFDRLYRPQALDTPVLVPRDGPIASLDPDAQGAFMRQPSASTQSEQSIAIAEAVVQVIENEPKQVTLVATAGVWLRVRDAEGAILLEKIMDANETFEVPLSDEPALIERAGNSGSLYFAIDGEFWGPVGQSATLAKNVILSPEMIMQSYSVYVPNAESTLFSFFQDVEGGADNQ